MSLSSEDVKVSVIIPAYNQARYLEITLESIFAQTYRNLEIIVVDDGSTDDTPALAERYSGRIQFIRQANRGVAAARNTGVRASSGQYLTFMDHDDVMLPNKIERQVALLKEHPEISFVHCGYYNMDEQGNYLNKEWILPEGKVLSRLICGDFLWVGGPLIRRECIEQVGSFNEESPWTADWDYWLRTALAGCTFACVQEPLGAYRIIPGSMMSYPEKLEKSVFLVLGHVFQDPRLPLDILAKKNLAYGSMRLWIGFRYFGGGFFTEGLRNLQEAFALRPELCAQPDVFLGTLRSHALTPHVADPVLFIEQMFAQLSALTDTFEPYRDQTLSDVHFSLALNLYGKEDLAGAREELRAALALNPHWADDPQRFQGLMTDYFMHLPTDDVIGRVEYIFDRLSEETPSLGNLRSPVLGDVHIGRAFQSYYSRKREGVITGIFSGVLKRPAVLGDKGIYSILMRSLLGQFP